MMLLSFLVFVLLSPPPGLFAAAAAVLPAKEPGAPVTAEGLAPQTTKVETASQEVTIHYGCNDSHSRSWACLNRNGVVGISFFRRFAGSDDSGSLIYETIDPDGTARLEQVTTGRRLEKSVLLFDSLARPHIFLATSDSTDQIVEHFSKNDDNRWQHETVAHFHNEGGRFIYELSADTGPDDSFHLLILKTRSDVDSDDYQLAWRDARLFYLTNAGGAWQRALLREYDTAYTYDHYVKCSSRQDIRVDASGFAHVVFSEQIDAHDDPSRLWYGTNRTGTWEFEIALNHDAGTRDDAGWFPSLCLDSSGTPWVSCVYVKRVYTYSAQYCRLLLLQRLAEGSWEKTVIADHDDGYFGRDGRDYTGALSHLVFDQDGVLHVVFSDIASTHWPSLNQRLNVGNIRHGVLKDGTWHITTVYRQPLPTGFFSATEMFGLCLLVGDGLDSPRIVGQELVITGQDQYSCKLVVLPGVAAPGTLRHRLRASS